jgi:transcriptional regulator
MYLPRHFEREEPASAHRLIRDNPFATLLRVHEGASLISHLPILLREEKVGAEKLEGHLAVRNPHADRLKDGDPVTVIFHGPHAYVMPNWYVENDVPTWNYAVVQVSGKIRWIREFKPLVSLLLRMTQFFEGGAAEAWKFYLPDDLKKPEDLTSAIVGFEVEIESLQAKFKLSQNRSAEDRAGVVQGLNARGDEMSLRLARMMEESR